jgi:hypothetical protein
MFDLAVQFIGIDAAQPLADPVARPAKPAKPAKSP